MRSRDMNFPDTQAVEAINAKAREQAAEKLARAEEEARYVYHVTQVIGLMHQQERWQVHRKASQKLNVCMSHGLFVYCQEEECSYRY